MGNLIQSPHNDFLPQLEEVTDQSYLKVCITIFTAIWIAPLPLCFSAVILFPLHFEHHILKKIKINRLSQLL